MSGSATVSENFDEFRVCVIIPTYNNASTLARVIEEVAFYTNNIIVVNDGSTDDTVVIVEKFPFVQLLTYPKNVGKGWALRRAFAFATKLNYRFAITIDSDGQHFASDLPTFIDKLRLVNDAII